MLNHVGFTFFFGEKRIALFNEIYMNLKKKRVKNVLSKKTSSLFHSFLD